MAPSCQSCCDSSGASGGGGGFFAAKATTLVLHLILLGAAAPATLAFLCSGTAGIARTNHQHECRTPRSRGGGRVTTMAVPSKSPSPPPSSKLSATSTAGTKKKSPPKGTTPVKFGGRVTKAIGQAPSDSAAKEEEDVRKSARWGVAPPPLPNLGGLGNPIAAVKDSVSGLGKGVTAAKDALYGAADAAGSLAELTQKQLSDGGKGPPSSAKSDGVDAATEGSPSFSALMKSSGAAATPGGDSGGLGASLKALGEGVVAVKDAFWVSVDLLGGAAEAAKNAPDTARSVAEEGRAAIEGAKERAQAIIATKDAAIDAVSEAVGGAGKAVSSIKEGAYGAADAVSRLASIPSELETRREREQQEREERAIVSATERRETARKLDAAVSTAKAAVWGTVGGVETLVDTVVAAPAAVGDGLGKAQNAVTEAGELLESIPRTVQEIPLEAQRKVDGVLASVTATQNTANELIASLKGGVDGVSSFAKKAGAIASGKAAEEKAERERQAAEALRLEKQKNALVTFQGEPYTAKDLSVAAFKAIGATAKGAVGVGKGVVDVVSGAGNAPAEAARVILGPVYRYQQSKKRVQNAIALDLSRASPPPPVEPSPSGLVEGSSSTVGSSPTSTVGSSSSTSTEASSPAAVATPTKSEATASVGTKATEVEGSTSAGTVAGSGQVQASGGRKDGDDSGGESEKDATDSRRSWSKNGL